MSDEASSDVRGTSIPRDNKSSEQPHVATKKEDTTQVNDFFRGIYERISNNFITCYSPLPLMVISIILWYISQSPAVYRAGLTDFNSPPEGRLATVLPLLLVLGSETLHTAFANETALFPCFGMLGCSFSVMVSAWRNTTLLPKPENAGKIINLKSGQARKNSSFVLSRVLNDLETGRPPRKEGLLIEVLEAEAPFPDLPLQGDNTLQGLAISKHLLELIVLIPIPAFVAAYTVYTRDVTVISLFDMALFLMLTTAYMPSWRTQQFSARKDRGKNNSYALLRGKGHRTVSIIQNADPEAWDLEDMAAPPELHYDYSSTLEICTATITFVFWLILTTLLVNMTNEAAAVMIVVLTMGTFQNLNVIISKVPIQKEGVPLKTIEIISHDEAISALQALEEKYPGLGEPLVKEFFPGGLRDHEEKWWDNIKKYRSETSSGKSENQSAETSDHKLEENTEVEFTEISGDEMIEAQD